MRRKSFRLSSLPLALALVVGVAVAPNARGQDAPRPTIEQTNAWILEHLEGYYWHGGTGALAGMGNAPYDPTSIQGCNVAIGQWAFAAYYDVGNDYLATEAHADLIRFQWGQLDPSTIRTRSRFADPNVPVLVGTTVEADVVGGAGAITRIPQSAPGGLRGTVESSGVYGLSMDTFDSWFAARPQAATTVELCFSRGDASWAQRAVAAVRNAVELCGGHRDIF